MSLEDAIELNFSQTIKEFSDLKIQLMILAKRQHIIMNKITARKSTIRLLKMAIRTKMSMMQNEMRSKILKNLTNNLAL